MVRWLGILVGTLRSAGRTHRELALKNLSRFGSNSPSSRVWKSWPSSLHMKRPETVVGWHREVAGRAYGRSNLRDVLVSLDEHKVEDFASNGFLQTENPDMAPFAAALSRKRS